MQTDAPQLSAQLALVRPQWNDRVPLRLFEEVFALEPDIAAAFSLFADTQMELVPDRLRELVALRVAADLDSAYVWAGHSHIAHPSVLSLGEIADVAVGPARFTSRDAAVLRAVDGLLREGRVDATTAAALGKDVLRVKFATGTYFIAAMLTHDLEAEPGTALDGLETPARARAWADTRDPSAQHAGACR